MQSFWSYEHFTENSHHCYYSLSYGPRSENTKQAIFRLYKSATTHLWQPSKSSKKNHGRTPEKKHHGSHLVNTRGGHLVFPNQPKKIPRQVFPMMNLSCKFGSCSYNILRDRKACVKTDARMDGRTHGHRAFYNLPYRAYRLAGDKKREVLNLNRCARTLQNISTIIQL